MPTPKLLPFNITHYCYLYLLFHHYFLNLLLLNQMPVFLPRCCYFCCYCYSSNLSIWSFFQPDFVRCGTLCFALIKNGIWKLMGAGSVRTTLWHVQSIRISTEVSCCLIIMVKTIFLIIAHLVDRVICKQCLNEIWTFIHQWLKWCPYEQIDTFVPGIWPLYIRHVSLKEVLEIHCRFQIHILWKMHGFRRHQVELELL